MSHYKKMSRHNSIKKRDPKLLPFTFAQYSIACERHPERNEDHLIADARTGLAAVFDGVGGSVAGDLASQVAARVTRKKWNETLQTHLKVRQAQTLLEHDDVINLPALLQQVILDADEQVRTEGARRAGTDDLATTVALAVFTRYPDHSGYVMTFAHVGDSRIYLLHEREPLKRLTSDDGLLTKLVENQLLSDQDALRIDQTFLSEDLSDIEFNYFRRRGGITQAVGGPIPISIHISQTTISPGDRVLLCTDGVHDNLVDQEIEEVLRQGTRSAVARTLIERSVERSHQDKDVTIRSKPDDMSAVVVTCRF